MSDRNNELLDLNVESFVFYSFRKTSSSNIKYNGRYFKCFRIERLLKSFLFKKSWIDSSRTSKPDYHNDKHHIMMEIFRVDDCVRNINGKHVPSSFEKQTKSLEKYFCKNYKERLKTCTVIFNADTSNDEEFNFEGYLMNFERVVMHHANRIDSYRKNFPNCKELIFFLCDESNCYYERNHLDPDKSRVHNCFSDKNFIDIIKRSGADYFVWFTTGKALMNQKGKIIKRPKACIYNIKHSKSDGYIYNLSAMRKLKY